jgi:hypothetical protein
MASDQVVTIDTLPPELLRQIFGFVDGPAPSEHRLNDQPAGDMLRSPDCPLKDISLVSKRWRVIVSPILFRNVVWALERCGDLLVKPDSDPDSDSDPIDQIPILSFLRANDLSRHIRSFTIIVCQRVAPEVSPMPLPGSTGSRNVSRFQNNAQWKAARGGHDGVFHEPQAHHSRMVDSTTAYNQDNNWLWMMLFSLMDPLKLTIIASPQTLASLLSCMVFVGDEDFFSSGERLHILSLSRDSKSTSAPPQPSGSKASAKATAATSHSCPGERKHIPTALFTIRPWTHLLLNENSSIRVYKSYHYFDRRQPSILPSLLGYEQAPNDTCMVPSTVTSLSYIAIFPLTHHFSILLYNLPHIEHFYLQLVPRNDILLDKQEMDHVQASDLWLERNSCYRHAMRKLLWRYDYDVASVFGDDFTDSGWTVDEQASDSEDEGNDTANQPPVPQDNWAFLRRFETGDSADQEAWDDAARQVENNYFSGWRVEREGLFVKGPVPAEKSDGGSASPVLV